MSDNLIKDEFLSQLKDLLKKHNDYDSNQVLTDISNFIDEKNLVQVKGAALLRMSDGDKTHFLNQFLLQKSLPKVRQQNNLLRNLALCCLMGLILSGFVFWKLKDIFTFDYNFSNIKLLSNGRTITLGGLGHKSVGEFAKDDVQKLSIMVGPGEMVIEGAQETDRPDKVAYECYTEHQNDVGTSIKDKHFTLEIKRGFKCHIKVPEGVVFELKQDAGSVEFYSLRQSFEANLSAGNLSWHQDRPLLYSLEVDNDLGRVTGDLSVFGGKSAGYQAKIKVDMGQVEIK